MLLDKTTPFVGFYSLSIKGKFVLEIIHAYKYTNTHFHYKRKPVFAVLMFGT